MQDYRQLPDMGDIIDKAKKAADSVSKASEKINETLQDTLDEAVKSTKLTIETIVTTAKTGLENILRQANVFGNETQEAVSGLLIDVGNSTNTLTFVRAANETLDVYNLSIAPLVEALKETNEAVGNALKSAGFIALSEEVLKNFREAIMPINCPEMVSDLKGILEDIDEKLNKTNTTISNGINEDLNAIATMLHNKLDELKTIFTHNLADGYQLVVGHLRATVQSALPENIVKQVNATLDVIPPLVEEIIDQAARPTQELENGFDQTINQLLYTMPAGAQHATGLGFLSGAVIACASWLAL